jgi:hypothetical protein
MLQGCSRRWGKYLNVLGAFPAEDSNPGRNGVLSRRSIHQIPVSQQLDISGFFAHSLDTNRTLGTEVPIKTNK